MFLTRLKRNLLISTSSFIPSQLICLLAPSLYKIYKSTQFWPCKILLILFARKPGSLNLLEITHTDAGPVTIDISDYACLVQALNLVNDPVKTIYRLGGDVFIDIGCHIGLYSIGASQYFKNVIAIDASKERTQLASDNAQSLSINNIKFYNYAVGSADSALPYYLVENPHNSGGSYIINSSEKLPILNTYEVPMRSLDSLILPFLRELSSLNRLILKIDVEGHEYSVLQGASNIIKSYSPVIILETRVSDFQRLKLSRTLGPTYAIFSTNEILQSSRSNTVDMDFVAVPLHYK